MGNDYQKFKEASVNEFFKRYQIIDKRGTRREFGRNLVVTVHKAIRLRDGKHFAIKVVRKAGLSSHDYGLLINEVENLMKLHHGNICHLYEAFETTHKIYMVLEHLEGEELIDRLFAKGSFTELEAAHVVANVASALSYLHGVGICHRDLKPENIRFIHKTPTSNVKLTDFVFSKNTEDVMKTICGTPNYVAPEVLLNKPYGKESDMWSLGVILYCLLCGYPPFFSDSTAGLYKVVKKGEYDFQDPFWTDISEEAKHLVRNLLVVDRKNRYTANQVLRHPWITTNAPAHTIIEHNEEHHGGRDFELEEKERELQIEKRGAIETFVGKVSYHVGGPSVESYLAREDDSEELGFLGQTRGPVEKELLLAASTSRHDAKTQKTESKDDLKRRMKGVSHALGLLVQMNSFFDRHTRTLDWQLSLITFVCFLCLIVYNQVCFNQTHLYFNDEYKVCPTAFWMKFIAWSLYFVLLWRLIVYYSIQADRKKMLWGYESREKAFLNTKLWKHFLLEALVNAVMPLPFTDNWGFENNIVIIFFFLRFYHWLRTFRDHCPIYRFRNNMHKHGKLEDVDFDLDSQTVAVAYFHTYPFLSILALFVVAFLILAYLLYITERQYWINTNHTSHNNYEAIWKSIDHGMGLPGPGFVQTPLSDFGKVCWLTITTMATVGYGDFYPRGWQGRLVIGIALFFGITVSTMMASVIINKLGLTEFDEAVINLTSIEYLEEKKRHHAATIVKYFIQHCVRNKKQSIKSKWQGLRAKIRPYVEDLRKLKRELREYEIEMEGVGRMTHKEKLSKRAHFLNMQLEVLELMLNNRFYSPRSLTRHHSTSSAHSSNQSSHEGSPLFTLREMERKESKRE